MTAHLTSNTGTTTSDRSASGVATTSGRLQLSITVLAVATALVHLYLGVVTTVMLVSDPVQVADLGGATALTVMAALFYLSFLGYLVLTVALYRPALHRYHRLARWALIAWAGGNVLAYFLLTQGEVDAFGLADKLCEILLVVLLVIDGRRRARA